MNEGMEGWTRIACETIGTGDKQITLREACLSISVSIKNRK
jgi:hypothetical protein